MRGRRTAPGQGLRALDRTVLSRPVPAHPVLALPVLLLVAAGPAAAQTADPNNKPAPIVQPGPPRIVPPGTPPGTVVYGQGTEKSGPGANVTVAPTGSGATSLTTDSAAAGNSAQPSRGVAPVGGGGGGGGGGT